MFDKKTNTIEYYTEQITVRIVMIVLTNLLWNKRNICNSFLIEET